MLLDFSTLTIRKKENKDFLSNISLLALAAGKIDPNTTDKPSELNFLLYSCKCTCLCMEDDCGC